MPMVVYRLLQILLVLLLVFPPAGRNESLKAGSTDLILGPQQCYPLEGVVGWRARGALSPPQNGIPAQQQPLRWWVTVVESLFLLLLVKLLQM